MPISQLDIISGLGGKLMPAHVFTPFKSFYGNCYDRLYYAFKDKFDRIPAVEQKNKNWLMRSVKL
jgi:PHP family Zn ribbon phosphoesterase